MKYNKSCFILVHRGQLNQTDKHVQVASGKTMDSTRYIILNFDLTISGKL